MMGEEPLEVPTTASTSTNSSHIVHRTFDSWDEGSQVVSVSRSSGAYAHELPNPSVVKHNNTPRRTRHRVDAGEPRGCFTNAGGSLPNANVFRHNLIYKQGFHHHPHGFPHHQYYQGAFNQLPPPPPPPQQQVINSGPGEQKYYFQPMKMLSEFISSASAVAAANATQTNVSRDQVLLREMLCKSESQGNQRINNNIPKYYESNSQSSSSKLDNMIGTLMDKQSEEKQPEVKPENHHDHHQAQASEHHHRVSDHVEEDQHAVAIMDSNSATENNNNESEQNPENKSADLLNNNTTTQQSKNKRKKYMPQKSDLVLEHEDVVVNGVEEDELEDGFEKRVTRSATKKHETDDFIQEDSPDFDEDFEQSGGERNILNTRVKRKVEECFSDMDEDEAMMMRNVGSRSSAATNNDDVESMIQEYENEEDEQEAMINDDLDHHASTSARRTLPVVRSLALKERKELNTVHSSAPLTRQLLTERPTTSQDNKGSILRPTIPLRPQLSSPVENGLIPQPSFLQQWKENLKTTLMSHINELVDAQFSLLFSGGMLNPPLLREQERRSLREPNEKNLILPPRPQSCVEQKIIQNDKRSPALVEPRSTTPRELKHLNGGSMHEKLEKIASPPLHEVKKLPVRNESIFNTQNRFPFMQNNGNGSGGVSNNNIPPKQPPHFSSALVGLSNQHLQQQALASVAAGIENMFDNDGALSLVVNRNAEQGNVTPRKKRHKVTDTRLTPRAVSRLLGQVDSYDTRAEALSPQNTSPINERVNNHSTPPPHVQQQHPNPPQQPRTPTTSSHAPVIPGLHDQPRLFNPFQNNPFFHPGAIAAAAAAAGHPMHRLDSPPMNNSLLHPALQNHSEYVERLREMSMERESREHAREPREHHVTSLREYPSVRGLRDRGSVMISGNDILDMISNRAGSAGGNSDSGGESNSAGFGELANSSGMYCHSTSTLTPMHLRKAKLMFFWTRYPSSAVIKMYFPDIKFNKNNTAQLVKWFSNFREFYYIQMEKYARQALSEGVKSAEDLHVTNDSELYRVLNLHYNRNNHIEVPTNFRFVVEQTLREFFKSVQAGKDSEQSWKKAIYKIIARLDDPVPEYFKSPNFLEQLE
ncbi:unnamed protein product [Orchesella dallaii]|uniref:Prospero domain-containing protein n=1 Tax=Orchesella dallaii TaxID=48710 RepID=A0ABP1Q7F6_9HEXA